MQLTKYIEELMAHTQKSQLPFVFRERVLHALKYFRDQSLCHGDRRDPPTKIKDNWFALEQMLIGTSLFDQFRSERYRWEKFMAELGIEKFPPDFRSPAPKKKSKFEDRSAEELMAHLARMSEAQSSFSQNEKNLVCIGLYYLELEARRGRSQRNRARIQQTWKLIQPILRKVGLLNEFSDEKEAIHKIKFFISDKFL